MGHVYFSFGDWSASDGHTTFFFDGTTFTEEAEKIFEDNVLGKSLKSQNEKNLAILNLKPGAAKSQIKKSYHDLVKLHHPDAGGDPAKFMEIQRAYEELS